MDNLKPNTGTPSNKPTAGSDLIVGESSAIQAVFELLDRVADTPATVLITGESGTGKELVAREAHRRSVRADKAFVAVNCTAIPANLLEAELFGYEKGAFTDAKIRKKGLLELAEGGTLFLDEIGLMQGDLQSKILSVLESLTFRRVGGLDDLHADVRIIAATNEDLEEAVSSGRFRQDLFYRLNVVPIQLPPLRDRQQDILLISNHFLGIYSERYRKSSLKFSKDAERWLRNYPWPGNVRELRNAMERAVLLCQSSMIGAEDLAIGKDERALRSEETSTAIKIDGLGEISIQLPAWGIALDDVESRLIDAALEQTAGNVSQAAQLLHISRDTLRYRIRKHRLDIRSYPRGHANQI